MSLAVFREGEPAELQRLVAALAAETRPFRLEFVGVDAFRTSEGVVFLEPAAAQELTHVHRRFTHLLGDDAGLVSAYYREDLWRPHCTVATGVPAHAIEEVIERCRNARVLSTALVRRMSITAYGPATSLLDCELEDDRGGRRP